MKNNYLLHTKDGNKVFTAEELIENAKQQEAAGIEPLYSFYDHKRKERITPPGWLVFSTYEDGCGVVYKYTEGIYHIVNGWQSEFTIA